MAYYKRGDNKKAKEKLKKALSLDSNFSRADEANKILSKLNQA